MLAKIRQKYFCMLLWAHPQILFKCSDGLKIFYYRAHTNAITSVSNCFIYALKYVFHSKLRKKYIALLSLHSTWFDTLGICIRKQTHTLKILTLFVGTLNQDQYIFHFRIWQNHNLNLQRNTTHSLQNATYVSHWIIFQNLSR